MFLLLLLAISATAQLAGDVTGPDASNTVVAIQGKAVSASAPTDGSALLWDTTLPGWAPSGTKLYLGSGTQSNSGTNCITFGQGASTLGAVNATSIGPLSSATAQNAIALGPYANAGFDFSLAFGWSATTIGNYSTTVGTASNAGLQATALGYGAYASFDNAVALGFQAYGNVNNGVAVGFQSTCNNVADSVAIGATASPIDTSHALAFKINSASVVAGTLGITVNGAGYVLPLRSSLYTTTAGAGPTTLTASSSEIQVFTTTQTVKLPVVSTLQLGFEFYIINKSTGSLTIQSSGGNTKLTLAASRSVRLICYAITGTTATSWIADLAGVIS